MPVVRVAKAVVLVIVFLCALPLRSQVTVYQNAAEPTGVAAEEAVEYGDEVNLVGNARVLTKIRFEYAGDFYANGDEKACIRIYANNGPFWKGNSDYVTPGSLLWESGFFPIQTGISTKELIVPSIRVQEKFTWTVEFAGLTMQTNVVTPDPNITNDFAGLSFYGNAEIGYSFNDFWERLTTVGWTPVRVASIAHNNFGVSVTALKEAVVPTLTANLYRTNYVLASWPRAASEFKLQYATKLSGPWANVGGPVPTIVGDFYNRVLDRAFASTVFLRLSLVPTIVPTLSITNQGDFVQISWPATSPGFVLQSKESDGALVWRDEYTPAAPVGDWFQVTVARTSADEVFRLREETKAAAMDITSDGTNITIHWPATAKNYALQSKPALGEQFWTLEARPTFTRGNYFEVVLPIAATNKIFRLSQ